uniref:L-dopachrome isomerase n=1 Tax=Cyanothece sp. (strain PCC 7425 / ATCC 29141) TaxID=395961 RepID=B8HLF8_CYAP4
MPLIKVQTSAPLPPPEQIETLLKTLSNRLAKHLGKPEAYVMTVLEPATAMTFAGTTEPVCYVEIKSIGSMSAAQTQTMSQDFCQQLEQGLGVSPQRIYIEFADARGAMWGWNRSTFG